MFADWMHFACSTGVYIHVSGPGPARSLSLDRPGKDVGCPGYDESGGGGANQSDHRTQKSLFETTIS